jgi:hypothetical protein
VAWKSIAFPALLVVIFTATRWPGLMPENFNAAYALAFCAGVYLRGWAGWMVPLVALLASDILINVAHYGTEPVSAYMMVNYACFALIIALGRRFSPRTRWIWLVSGGLLGAVVFYLVTNTASWVHNQAYARSLQGWIQSLTVGTPGHPPTWMFFKNTLLSGGLFTGLFAGAMKWSARQEEKEEPEAREEEPAGKTEPTEA